MPDPREIERLKKTIRALAKEDEVLSARGDSYVDLPPPPELTGMRDPDLARQRLAEESENVTHHFADPPEPGPSEGAPEEDAAPDFSSLLQDIDFSAPETADAPSIPDDAAFAEEPESTGIPDIEEPSASGIGDFDLGSFVEPPTDLGSEPSFDDGSISAAPLEETPPPADASSFALDAEAAPMGDLGADLSGFGDSFPDFGAELGSGSAAESPDAGAVEFGPSEELFADEGLTQAELSSARERGAETPADIPQAMELEGEALPGAEAAMPAQAGETPAEPDAFDIPSFELGDMGGSLEAESGMDLGGEGQLEEAPGFDAGIQARVDLEPPASPAESGEALAGGGSAPSAEAKADEDPFASFNFDDGGLLGSTPSMDSIDSGLASLDQEPKAGDVFGDEAAWGGPAPLGDFGSQNAFEAKPSAERLGAGASFEAAESEPEEISLTEKEVDRLQDSLLSYPRNLRLEIEQCIANDVLPPKQTADLVKALVDGKGAAETAALLGRFLGKRIPVPKGFEKKTGEQFEAERGTFWYAFRTNILPLVGIVAAVLLALAVIAFLGVNFVVKPLYADSIYRSGVARIHEDDFKQAESLFDTAVKVKRVRLWYFKYAEEYKRKKQYALVEKKYEELLHPAKADGSLNYSKYVKDKKAALDYARFESEDLLAFEQAEKILKSTVLDWWPNDADGRLLYGDNALSWADDSGDEAFRAEKLEVARKSFAALIRINGRKNAYLGRMLRYFVRTDNMKQTLILKSYFLSKKKPVVDSIVYAELGAYLIDANRKDDVRSILLLGVNKDPRLPDNHYELARYYRATGNKEEEAKALRNAERTFEAYPSLNRRRLMDYIDTLGWLGDQELTLQREGNLPVKADEYYDKAIKAYERGLDQRLIQPSARFGELYAKKADFYYSYAMQYETAFKFYQDAERNKYSTPETAYKRGWIRYDGKDYKTALGFFYQASGDFTVTDNLLFAMANALYYREDYSAASGYYLQLRKKMRDEIDRIQYQDPQNRPDQSRIVRLLMDVSNNLGVSLYHLANRSGDASRRSEALACFTESMRLYDVMNRDQTTMLRPKSANLAFLNFDGILHPTRGFVPLIAPVISRDLVDSDEKVQLDAQNYAGKKQ